MTNKPDSLPENSPGTGLHQNLSLRLEAVSLVQNEGSESMETLCKPCKSMFSTLDGLRALASEKGYEWLSFEEISDATRGCSLCKLLKEEGFHYAPEKKIYLRVEPIGLEPNKVNRLDTGYPSEILSAGYLLRVDKWGSKSASNRVLTIGKIQDDESASLLSCSYLSYDMAGDEAMSSCLSMLEQCQEKHESCESQRIPLLPTKVIDLEDPEHPRLCISEKNQRDCYVTLSYCWGGPQEVKLTKDTIDAKIKGFQLKDLPQTIQDAIQVTGKLGFRYLWIDALCIIQDDREDQNLEIQSMGNIYRNSTLTIAASDSKSVQNGFLKSQSQYSTCKLPFYLPNNRMGNIEVAYYKQMASQEKWYLNTRAWALQEELLSPRILFFADGEIRWQCQSVYKERVLGSSSINFEEWQGLQRLPPSVFVNRSQSRKMEEAVQPPDEKASKEQLRQEQSNIWRDIIKNYSKRGITEPLDRLPALAGIIGELEKAWLDKCIAGLWKNCFLEHLLWQKIYGNTTGCTAPIYKGCQCKSAPRSRPEIIAPTWSWVSCGQLVSLGEIQILKSTLLSCSIQLLDEQAPLGPVKSGKCIIRASVIKGPIKHNLGPKLRSESNPVRVDSIDPCAYTCDEIFERAVYARIGTYNVSPRTDPKHPGNKFIAKGLVLMEVGEGLFERVGVFTELKDVFDDSSVAGVRTVTII